MLIFNQFEFKAYIEPHRGHFVISLSLAALTKPIKMSDDDGDDEFFSLLLFHLL